MVICPTLSVGPIRLLHYLYKRASRVGPIRLLGLHYLLHIQIWTYKTNLKSSKIQKEQ